MASHHPSPSPETFAFPSDDDANSSDEDTSAPPVLVSPIKRRQRATAPGINKQSDLEVWELSDEDIIAAAKTTWRSDAYDHYSVSLQCNFGSKREPLSLS
ncbi:hypothetical protein K443DRAFT_9293 [Laccaria amethystina LaAM-08-1]|uniref:Uncharacterized protein n=1 Tax=Laccaria amethystina LaAM-08-1 TaxID=1095629 RepID=A0A0C9XKX9_9AGAR|nr:hypothetical protein K443DRAFT_9293 [Laccaria amethystina LaAM-08-1]